MPADVYVRYGDEPPFDRSRVISGVVILVVKFVSLTREIILQKVYKVSCARGDIEIVSFSRSFFLSCTRTLYRGIDDVHVRWNIRAAAVGWKQILFFRPKS